jgi:hypothetical protein
MRSLTILVALFAASAGLTPPVQAQTQRFETHVTVVGHNAIVKGASSDHFLAVDRAIGIPGIDLPPGTYIFRLVAPRVMQVLDEDRSTVYATFFVTPAWRNQVTGQYVLTLRNRGADPLAKITTMFPAGTTAGYDLLYPKIKEQF